MQRREGKRRRMKKARYTHAKKEVLVWISTYQKFVAAKFKNSEQSLLLTFPVIPIIDPI